jgi:hypothetical protein
MEGPCPERHGLGFLVAAFGGGLPRALRKFRKVRYTMFANPMFAEMMRQWDLREELFYLQARVETTNGWQTKAILLGGGLVLEGPPAEEAPLGAPEGRGHLDAPVALDPVEPVLVAHLPAAESPLAPEAGLHRRRRPGETNW